MMKKILMAILFLFLFVNVSAMEYPIKVLANEGNRVNIYARLQDTGFAINIANGIADENGEYSITFYSLNLENITYHITVSGEDFVMLNEGKFEGFGILEPLIVDCTLGKCKMSYDTSYDKTSAGLISSISPSTNIENNSNGLNETNFSIETNESENLSEILEKENTLGTMITGNAVFGKRNNLIIPSLIGIGIFFGILILFSIFSRRRKLKKKLSGKSEEDFELEEIQAKIKDREKRILELKEKKKKKNLLDEAKKKLEKEESELKALSEDDSDKKGKMESIRNSNEELEKLNKELKNLEN